MKDYKLFASIYGSKEEIYFSGTRDIALEMHNNSEVVPVRANDIGEAVYLFQNTKLFDDFCVEHLSKTVYTYTFDQNLRIKCCSDLVIE